MDILGVDISKLKFDVVLIVGERSKHAVFSNTEAGFQQLRAWLDKQRPDPARPLQACMEATGNWGLDLADFLHESGVRVSIVNPLRIKAFGQSELARNKNDKLDAGVIARFCRTQNPPLWVPPAPHLRELRELVRRCNALKDARVQEANRQKSGFVSPAVAQSIEAHLAWLDNQIAEVSQAALRLIQSDPTLRKNLALLRSITGLGEVAAGILLAELPNIADFTPKALAAFVGLSPQEHSSGSSVRRPGRMSKVGAERLRGTLFMCAFSAKRFNPRLADFVKRMTDAGKAPKVILVAVARKLLVYAHAVIRTQKPFQPFPDAPSSI